MIIHSVSARRFSDNSTALNPTGVQNRSLRPGYSLPNAQEPRFSAELSLQRRNIPAASIALQAERALNFLLEQAPDFWNRTMNRLEEGWFKLNRRFHPVSVPHLTEALLPLLQQSSSGISGALLRADRIEKGSLDAFSPLDKLKNSHLLQSGNSPERLLQKLITSESSAYLASHLIALENAIQTPEKLLQFRTSNPSLKSIALAVEDANHLGVCHVEQRLYGKDKTPVADSLYNLISASPKVTLHEHYRGCAPISMVRARLMSRLQHQAFLSTEDFEEHCRTDRLFTPDGKRPRYHRTLNRFRSKYDMIAQSVYSDSTAYLNAYMYALRLGLEKVRYFEYRLNPLSKDVKDPLRYIQAIQTGLDDAMDFIWRTRNWKMDANLIIGADRQPKPGVDLTPKPGQQYDPRVELALKILDTAIQACQSGLRVTGFDIQGDEEGYAITDFKPVADRLKAYNRRVSSEGRSDLRIGATIHAGEVARSGVVSQPDDVLTGEESIAKAIELFWDTHTPLRIGHGNRVIFDPSLIQECKEKSIGFEQCPKSNFQSGAVDYYHALPSLTLSRNYGLKVSINSDNRTLCKTDSCNEMVKLARHLKARHADRKKFQMDGIDMAFIFDPDKKQAIRQEMEVLYTALEANPEHQRVIRMEQDKKSFKALLENRAA